MRSLLTCSREEDCSRRRGPQLGLTPEWRLLLRGCSKGRAGTRLRRRLWGEGAPPPRRAPFRFHRQRGRESPAPPRPQLPGWRLAKRGWATCSLAANLAATRPSRKLLAGKPPPSPPRRLSRSSQLPHPTQNSPAAFAGGGICRRGGRGRRAHRSRAEGERRPLPASQKRLEGPLAPLSHRPHHRPPRAPAG